MTKKPEPIILAVALIILALGAAALAYSFPGAVDDIKSVTATNPTGTATKKLKAEDLTASTDSWNSPVMWVEPADHHRLFHSDKYLFYATAYPSGDYIKKLDPLVRAPSGVLISWYEKSGLSFEDPGVDREDPDGDGFSNIVEYKNEGVGERLKAADCDGSKSTNPLDAKSHPSYLSRLRLQKYESKPFHILFKGYQQLNGQNLFQISLADVSSDHQPGFKKTGDQLGVEGWVVGEFKLSIVQEKDQGTGLVVPVDRSTLELDRADIGLKVIVPFRKEVDSPESTADFVMLMPSEVDKVMKVSAGKILTVPFIPVTDAQYLVLAADDNGATIRDTKTKQEYHILKLDTAEWDEVPIPAPAVAPKSP